MHEELLEKFTPHQDFLRVSLDAYVLVDFQGTILRFNQAFCTLVQMRAVELKKQPLFTDILSFSLPGASDHALKHLLKKNTRLDDIPATYPHGTLTLTLSNYVYTNEKQETLGTCLLLRDVTAEANLQNKYVHRTIESVTDPLTGLFTRRYFEDYMDKELARCREKGLAPSFAVMIFDLDRFKSINDKYGHQAGDYVLKETARVLRSQSRRSDVIGRYGGEEILLVASAVLPDGALLIAEKLRKAIETHVFVFEGQTISVTTSVGVTYISYADDTREAAVKRADQCLYQAKHLGRNKVVSDLET